MVESLRVIDFDNVYHTALLTTDAWLIETNKFRTLLRIYRHFLFNQNKQLLKNHKYIIDGTFYFHKLFVLLIPYYLYQNSAFMIFLTLNAYASCRHLVGF